MSEVQSTTDQTESNEPLWQVQLASGQVCRMTLELLDDAFQDGLITEDTLIMQDGTSEWVTLRAVAGLDSEAEAPAVAAPAPVAAPVVAPVAAAPVVAQPAPYMDPFAPPIQVVPAPVVAPQMMPPASPQAAPFVFQGAAQSPSFPPQGFPASIPEPLTRSTAPVAADIDFDLETVHFGKKRSPAKWIIGIAAVLGGLGFAAMNMNSTPETAPAAAAAPRPAAPPAYESTPAQPSPMTPIVTKPEPTRLSDDAKRALMEADKTRHAKMQQQRASQSQSRGGGGSSGPRKKADPFHKGGDKFDPLNASL